MTGIHLLCFAIHAKQKNTFFRYMQSHYHKKYEYLQCPTVEKYDWDTYSLFYFIHKADNYLFFQIMAESEKYDSLILFDENDIEQSSLHGGNTKRRRTATSSEKSKFSIYDIDMK